MKIGKTQMKEHEEMLVITMEECGELIQACSKFIRTGGKARYRQNLRDEIGDVVTMIEIIKASGLITQEQIDARVEVKRNKLTKWSNLFDETEIR
jgi:NTP pyrophosphatase (non-canonical NTP hydrolase)